MNLLVAQVQRPVGEELDVERRARDDARQVAHEQRSVVCRLHRGEFLGVLEDNLREALENAMASFRAELRPRRKCATRGGHGRIDFSGAAGAHVGEVLAVNGRAVLESLLRRDALAVDEVLGGYIDSGNFRGVHFITSKDLVLPPRARFFTGVKRVLLRISLPGDSSSPTICNSNIWRIEGLALSGICKPAPSHTTRNEK